MNPTRRGFLGLFGGAVLAAPAIVQVGSIMPVRVWVPPKPVFSIPEISVHRFNYDSTVGVAVRVFKDGVEHMHAVRWDGRDRDEEAKAKAMPYLIQWAEDLKAGRI